MIKIVKLFLVVDIFIDLSVNSFTINLPNFPRIPLHSLYSIYPLYSTKNTFIFIPHYHKSHEQ